MDETGILPQPVRFLKVVMQKSALVTGATGGIGSVIAKRLLGEGYSLLLLGKTPSKVTALCAELQTQRRPGQTVAAVCIDMAVPADWPQVRTLVDTACAQGHPLDLAVICHAVAPTPGPALGALDDLRTGFEVDVLGSFRVCQLAGASMLERQHGSIVIISSIHAQVTYPQRAVYALSKSALGGLIRALALEWGPSHIRCNAILPWQTAGARTEAFIREAASRHEDLLELYKQKSPMRQLISPDDIANTVLWLARTESVNGASIVLDTGVSASMWFHPFLGKEDEGSVSPEHSPDEGHLCTGAECPYCGPPPVRRVMPGVSIPHPPAAMPSLRVSRISGRMPSHAPSVHEQGARRRLAQFRDSLGHGPTQWPKALAPSITAIIRDRDSTEDVWRVLVHQRADNLHWGFPGGAQHRGESLEETVHREVHEETGAQITVERLVCVHSDPCAGALCSYADGVMHYTNLTFLCWYDAGEICVSQESTCVRWSTTNALPQPFLPTHTWRLDEAFRVMAGGNVGVR